VISGLVVKLIFTEAAMSRTVPARLIENNHPKKVELHASLYSIAAAAAGVSALALAQPAVGEVVITNKTIPIPLCFSSPCPVSIDLNKDGIEDFQFELTSHYSSRYSHVNRLTAKPLKGGGVVGSAGGAHGPYASCLLRGTKIGASAHFLTKADTIEQSHFFFFSTLYSRSFYGKWGANQPNRFLGVKFQIKGATHFGWIRLTVTTSSPGHISATINEYGYETVANKSLDAGLSGSSSSDIQTQEISHDGPSLGTLALGMDGLALWRRDETLPS
jgi:hypothetical protein